MQVALVDKSKFIRYAKRSNSEVLLFSLGHAHMTKVVYF